MKYLYACCFVFVISSSAIAAEVDTIFDPATGRLLIPHLVIGGNVYWVELELVDAASLQFRIDARTAFDITPQSNYVIPARDALVGTWVVDLGAAQQFALGEFRMTFFEDGTYQFRSGGRSDECGAGDLTGNYFWEPKTGILLATRNESGDICDLAPSSLHARHDEIMRVYVVSPSRLDIKITSNDLGLEEFTATRI